MIAETAITGVGTALQVFYAILETFLMFGIGAWCCRIKIFTPEILNKMSKLMVDVFFPLMIFHSIYTRFNPEDLQQLWIAPLTGFLMMAMGAIIGWPLIALLKTRNRDKIVTFHHFCAINNYLFLPLIVLQNVWGDTFLPTLFIMNIGFTVAFWTIGVALLAGKDMGRAIKNIFGINQAVVVLALFFCFFNLKVPAVVEVTCKKLGDSSVPLMLVLIGGAIYFSAGNVFKNIRDALVMAAVRLVIIPLILILMLKLIPLPYEVYVTAFVVSLMPVSASSAMITTHYGGSTDFAGQSIIFTTTLSILTIPLLMKLL
ncbi:MAG: AEC family transporter [Victivallaceae bacterium]|jgi:predicted permease|nr:AEC family transporter [Victivallaceae bacterium]MDD5664181.1 AEC family transporter [Victivallaceae bacterium]